MPNWYWWSLWPSKSPDTDKPQNSQNPSSTIASENKTQPEPTVENRQERKRKQELSDRQLLFSSPKRNRSNVIDDPVAISFFAELGLSQDFLNGGNVLAWALRRDDPDFLRIHQYVERSQGWQCGIKLLSILRVLPHAKSLQNSTTTVDFKDDPDAAGRLRMMLWHGTKTGNLQSILENGLKLPNNFGAFGQGIYLADRVWTSSYFTDHGQDQAVGRQGYLFLCEVLLGNIFKSEENLPHLTMPPQPQYYQSVQGLGHWYPDPEWNVSVKGCVWPMGNIKDNQSLSWWNQRIINEFIVYDTAQVRPKYLIKFEFTNGKFFHKIP